MARRFIKSVLFHVKALGNDMQQTIKKVYRQNPLLGKIDAI